MMRTGRRNCNFVKYSLEAKILYLLSTCYSTCKNCSGTHTRLWELQSSHALPCVVFILRTLALDSDWLVVQTKLSTLVLKMILNSLTPFPVSLYTHTHTHTHMQPFLSPCCV